MTPENELLLANARAVLRSLENLFPDEGSNPVTIDCIRDLLALAEARGEMLVEATARGNFYKDWMEFGEYHFWGKDDAPDFVEHFHATAQDMDDYRGMARDALEKLKAAR